MKLSLSFVAALLCAWPVSAQQPNPPAPQPTSQINTASQAAQSITLSGCVGGINQAPGQFSLSSAAVVPSLAQPSTPSPVAAVPPAVTPTTPPTTATPPPTTPPSVAPPPGSPATTAATGSTPPATAAAGVSTGINASAAAPQPAATASAYRLSGLDMAAWSGQRVQVLGVVVPAAGSSANRPVGTSGTMGTTLPEFRVQSVTPAAGDCPPQP
jgi:hypothetical protein